MSADDRPRSTRATASPPRSATPVRRSTSPARRSRATSTSTWGARNGEGAWSSTWAAARAAWPSCSRRTAMGDEVRPGAAAELHVPRLGHGLGHLAAHHFVVVAPAPAAVHEAAAGVLVRAAEALHDAVEGDPHRDPDRTHGPALFRAAGRPAAALSPPTRTATGEIDTAASHACADRHERASPQEPGQL
jgi:hypothetical protein